MMRRFIGELRDLSGVLPVWDTCRYLACVGRASFEVASRRKLWPADLRMTGSVRPTILGKTVHVNLSALDNLISEDASSAFSTIREMYARSVYTHCFDFNRMPLETAVDAGGNRGFFTALMSRFCRTVMYVEPQIQFRGALEKLLADNPSECVVIMENAFLGRAVAESNITLSALMKKHRWESISFLKCDIEGAEFDLLQHDRECLSAIGNLSMEVHRSSGEPARLASLLETAGFEVIAKNASRVRVHPTVADYLYASRTGSLIR